MTQSSRLRRIRFWLTVFIAVTETTRAEVRANSDAVLLVGEQIDIRVSAAHTSEKLKMSNCLPRLELSALASTLGTNRVGYATPAAGAVLSGKQVVTDERMVNYSKPSPSGDSLD
jgi:hypothetical protein